MKWKINRRAIYDLVTLVAVFVLAGVLVYRYAPEWVDLNNLGKFLRWPGAAVREETSGPKGFNYSDPVYGFTLRLPASWQGVVVSRRAVGWAGSGTVPVVDFSLDADGSTARMFSIYVMNSEQWQAAGQDASFRRVGVTGDTVFAAVVNRETPGGFSDRAAEVEEIINTLTAS